MKGKERRGDGSANWQFAPPDQRSLRQAQALSSVAAASINVRQGKMIGRSMKLRKLDRFALRLSIRSLYPNGLLHEARWI